MATKTYGPGSSLLAAELNEYQDEYIDAMYSPWTPVGNVGFYVYPRVERYPLYGWSNSLGHASYVWPEALPHHPDQGGFDPTVDENFSGVAGNLNGRSIPGNAGSWATSGAATDFAAYVTGTEINRTAISDTSIGRIALAGSTTYTAVTLRAEIVFSSVAAATTCNAGLIARYVDANNHVRIVFQFDTATASTGTLRVIETVAGTPVTLVTSSPMSVAASTLYELVARVQEDGAVHAQFGGLGDPIVFVDPTSANLAASGALASGRLGLVDLNSSAVARTRIYDNFKVWSPRRPLVAGYLDVGEFPGSYNGTLRADKLRLVSRVTTDELPITTLLKSVALRNVPAQALSLIANPDSTAYRKWNLGTEYGKITFPSISDKFKTIDFVGTEFDFPPKGLYTIEMTPGTPAISNQGARVSAQLQRRVV